MMTATVIITHLSGIILALTPVERWQAARKFDSNFMTERWFILIGAIVIIALMVLLAAVSYYEYRQRQKAVRRSFAEHANRRGLSGRERQILVAIARKMGLKRDDSIFTMGNAFDQGASKIVEENLRWKKIEVSKQLRTELSFLREKLGFRKRLSSSLGLRARSKRSSSRQIAVGKKVHITHRKSRGAGDIEAAVIKNDNMGLTVKLAQALRIGVGELCRVRYYFGASIWEFDASVLGIKGEAVVLNHSNDIRFVNRRRFPRAKLKRPAYVARFPFAKTVICDSNSDQGDFEAGGDLEEVSAGKWGPPEFVPAVITELGGLGLRIEAALEVKRGERVLLVFNLGIENGQDLTSGLWDNKPATSRVIQDIAEVRHTKAVENGVSMAVELMGLSDLDVDELIQATNAAAVRASARGKNVSEGSEERAGKPADVRGD